MTLDFWKMNGAGNDFVVVDNRDLSLSLTREQIARLCDRQRGIGADGLLAVEPSTGPGDVRMRYYNADGGEAEMCGNGARCFARFVDRLESRDAANLTFDTPAGLIHAAFPFSGGDVRIGLSRPFDLRLNTVLEVENRPLTVHSVNTGVPHAVIIVPDVDEAGIVPLGRAVRHHEAFAPAGTNVNVLSVVHPGRIRIRTYERGVEDETLACGTGMVAAAIIHHELAGAPSPVEVQVKGGDTLAIEFARSADGSYDAVTLTGPADFVFQGTIQLD